MDCLKSARFDLFGDFDDIFVDVDAEDGKDIEFEDDDDDDDDDDAAMLCLMSETTMLLYQDRMKPRRGGSLPGRSRNKPRNFQEQYERMLGLYFAEQAVYNDEAFCAHFRMTKTLFQRVLSGVLEVDPQYFEQRQDCTRRMGIHPLLKVTAALRVLAHGSCVDCLNSLDMSESTVFASLHHFVDAVYRRFGQEYLRCPTEADAKRLADGFVGIRRSSDCMRWEWGNTSVQCAGQLQGKDKKPTVVLEAWADRDLWIWHASLGSVNETNVPNWPPIFDNLTNGQAPRAQCEGLQRMQAHLSEQQEALKENAERAFEALQARWSILALPWQHRSRVDSLKIARACITLHNMIVEESRRSNRGAHG